MNEPLTTEGFEVWEVIQRCSGQLKFYPSGSIAGFDVPTVLCVTQAFGYDLQAMLLLIEYAEAGLREAVKKHVDSNTEHLHPVDGNRRQ